MSFHSPNSSPLMTCWSFPAWTQQLSCVISLLYNWSAGGFNSRSLTYCQIRAEGANDAVKLSFLSSKAFHDKLCLNLHKPDCWVCWPKQTYFTLMAATRAGTNASSVDIEFSSVAVSHPSHECKTKCSIQSLLVSCNMTENMSACMLRIAKNVVYTTKTSANTHSNAIMYTALYTTHIMLS